MTRRPDAPLMIDCATRPVQHVGCSDCMVTALLSPQHVEASGAEDLPLDRREREIVSRLVTSGLVSAETATRARAVREPWSEYREVTREVG